MNRQRLGCFTGTGIITTLLTALAIMVLLFLQGNAMFSPGELNAQPGAMLGGVNSHAQATCNACHTAFWETDSMADHCASCHTDIAAQMLNVASLHGAITHRNPDLSCDHCHPDHRGPEASLTVATITDFPHEELGYSLNGHQLKVTREAFLCSDCHTTSFSSFDPVVCADCHQQMNEAFLAPHTVNWGADCLACHDGVDTYGDDFDHNRFAFQLTGGHAQVACYDCHVNARSLVDLRNQPQDCTSCHLTDDAHEGRFGTDCGSCHSSEGWKPAKFDHNLSGFPLLGKHGEVACEDCHQSGVYEGTPLDCYSCHAQDDEHAGRFGSDCGSCHTPNSWEEATFDHNLSNFPLTGAHVAVDCEKCHSNDQFAGTSTACVNCHQDSTFHFGLFGTDCASCHTTTAWSPAQFNQRHVFPLNHGESGQVACITCHPASFTVYTCYGCHEHNEADIRSEHLEEGIANYANCMECHPTGNEHEGGDD